ncbi:hypothetical protein ACQE3D_18725 [Methylomonas sp. MS20]|uniref:hypothetical protein n=1 Tax=Methylomonas sp. MS20 TaxID=3418769 RepID=UPI003D066376
MQDGVKSELNDTRTSLNTAALKQAILDHVTYSLGRLPEAAPEHSYYKALALTVRDRLQHLWIHTMQTYLADARVDKMVCYFSAEFLIGPQLGSSLVNLGIEQEVRTAVAGLGKNLDDLETFF